MKIIRKYTNNIKYILEHKKNVFIECFKAGLYVHAFTHDLSKLRLSEFIAYSKKIDGGFHVKKSDKIEDDFNYAWFLHQRRNKHHWDYWVNGEGDPIKMPKKYILQMICDWKAMGRKFNDTALDFYLKKKDEICLHSESRKYLEYLLEMK